RVRVGDRVFTPDGDFDYDDVVLGWMDRYVRGIDNGTAGKPVHVFVWGTNRWIAADRWPVPGVQAETLFFSPQGRLSRSRSANPDTVAIVSDPAQPVRNEFAGTTGAHDYRMLAEGPGVA